MWVKVHALIPTLTPPAAREPGLHFGEAKRSILRQWNWFSTVYVATLFLLKYTHIIWRCYFYQKSHRLVYIRPLVVYSSSASGDMEASVTGSWLTLQRSYKTKSLSWISGKCPQLKPVNRVELLTRCSTLPPALGSGSAPPPLACSPFCDAYSHFMLRTWCLVKGEETAGQQEGAVMNIWFSLINGTRVV